MPMGAAPADAAVLVLVYPASLNSGRGTAPGTWVDVLTEEGEALARLLPGTWTSMTRPSGRQRFYVVPSGGPSPCVVGANATVGVLEADLVAGRYAHAAVLLRRPMFSAAMSAMCCSDEGTWIDLVRVPLLGEVRAAALDVMVRGRSVEPLPQGMFPPFAERVQQLAIERESAPCFDPGPSSLRREDQTAYPMTAESSLTF